MTEQTKTRFPAPLYAAAGAGDLAVQQLRKLPAVVNELSERAAASLRVYNEQAGTKATELRDKASTTDFVALRGNAASVATSFAQIAQDRALAAYTALVARGERVVGTGVVEAADVVNADIETSEIATSEIATSEIATSEIATSDIATAEIETAEEPAAIEAKKAETTPKPRKRPAGK